MIDNVIKVMKTKTAMLKNSAEICSATQFPPKNIQTNPINTAVT